MDWLRPVGNVLAVIAAAGAVTFVAAYWWLAPWRRSQIGRHLMAYSAVVAVLLSLTVVRIFIGDSPVFAVIRLLAFVPMPFLVWHRVWLLYKAQRGGDLMH